MERIILTSYVDVNEPKNAIVHYEKVSDDDIFAIEIVVYGS